MNIETDGNVSNAEDDLTRIILVRHGTTEWNARDVYQGWEDIPLDATGVAQANTLAGALAGVEIDAAYTSPLVRARDTARIVLHGRGVISVVVPDFRELSYGRLTGKTPAERQTEAADLENCWRADPWSVEFPEGESLAALAARVLPTWDRIIAAHVGETVLVSSHGHVNRVLLLHARNMPREKFWSIEQPNGSAEWVTCAPVAREAIA